MALQWMILGCVVAVEGVVAVLLTLPWPAVLRHRLASLMSLVLQPAAGVVFFAAFQLLDLYWKKENRMMCATEVCTAEEWIHYEKSIFKAQRNFILCVLACLLYWCIYRICNFHKEIKELEEIKKRHKNL